MQMRRQSLLGAISPDDDGKLSAFGLPGVARAEFARPVGVVGVESADRNQLIARLDARRSGGTSRNHFGHVQAGRVLQTGNAELRHMRRVPRESKTGKRKNLVVGKRITAVDVARREIAEGFPPRRLGYRAP